MNLISFFEPFKYNTLSFIKFSFYLKSCLPCCRSVTTITFRQFDLKTLNMSKFLLIYFIFVKTALFIVLKVSCIQFSIFLRGTSFLKYGLNFFLVLVRRSEGVSFPLYVLRSGEVGRTRWIHRLFRRYLLFFWTLYCHFKCLVPVSEWFSTS